MAVVPEEVQEIIDGEVASACGVASRSSLQNYLDVVTIDGSRGPVVFGHVAESWQRRSLWPIMAALEKTCGINPAYTGPQCFWRDLPQGHDKTSGIARICNGVLAFSPKRVRIGVFACDKGQAGRIRDFMNDEAQFNPFIKSRVQYVRNEARNERTGSRLNIYSADAASNSGHKFDLTICEEITFWPEKGDQLYSALWGRRTKIEGAVYVVLGNAGINRTWQAARKEEARRDPDWDYFRTEGSVAGWQDRAKLAKDRRQMVPSMARRIIDNQWIDEDEQVYLTRAEVNACLQRAHELGVQLEWTPSPNVRYYGAIDYAVRKDWCALCMLGWWPDGTERVAVLDVLRAQDYPDRRIPLEHVEEWAVRQNRIFRNPAWVVDPYQMEWFCQKYGGMGGWNLERFQYRGGMTNYAMAEFVRAQVIAGRLLWPSHAGLLYLDEERPYSLADEFCDLITTDMPYGYRWDHKAQKHDDRAMAVGMAAYWASQVEVGRTFGHKVEMPDVAPKPKPPELYLRPTSNFTIWGPEHSREE